MRRLLKMGSFLVISVLTAILSLTLVSPAMAQPVSPTIDDVAGRVICMCGCGSVLNNCIHQECMVRDEMRGAISLALKQGKSADEIVASLVSKYGEQVLAAPTKKGFNLTAWITPFLAIVIGGVTIFFILKAWAFKGAAPVGAPAPGQTVVPEKYRVYRQKLEDELKQYGENL